MSESSGSEYVLESVATASSSKRFSYTITYKLEVVQYAKKRGNRAASRHFGPLPTEKMIRQWRKQEKELQKVSNKKKHNLRQVPPKWPDLEEKLRKWVVDHRNLGIAMNMKKIIYEARRLAASTGVDNFKGTESWCFRFMKRNGLSLQTRTKIAKTMPREFEQKILDFRRLVINTRKRSLLKLSQIGSMAEVPLNFIVPSNKSVDMKGSRFVIGYEKPHYTAVLACCANGIKLPPLLISKGKALPKEKLPDGIYIITQNRGWLEEEWIKVWLENVWSKRPGGLQQKNALLIWDQSNVHKTDSTTNLVRKMNTKLAVIPDGLASHLQPLGESINLFKNNMCEEWTKWMANGEHKMTPTGRMKRPSVSQVCEYVLKSWNNIVTEGVVKSFKKCGISNAVDGSDDHLLYMSDSRDDSSGDNVSELSEESSSEEFSGFEDK